MVQKITPFLWFDNNAEEAANFYVSIFKDSKMGDILRYGEGGMGEPGSVLTVQFQIEGQQFTALNGGPHYSFTPAVSFFVSCETQQEVDELWDKLVEGGTTMQCGWVTDKFGVTWQITPRILLEYLKDQDAEKARRVTDAMLQMVKLDIAKLKEAYEQG